MKKAPVTILLACISTLLCSCYKTDIGPITDETRHVGPFQIVKACDDIEVRLIHCDASHEAGTILLSAGANLIDGITTETEECPVVTDTDTLWFNSLVVTNNNAYNNFRPHNHAPEMTIYYDSLYKLEFYSNARNCVTDTLHGYAFPTHFSQDTIEWDSLAPNLLVEVLGGSGNFYVTTSCYKLTTKCIHGTANITVKGKATLASTFSDYDSHGIIESDELDSHIHYISTYGTNVITAKSFHLLDIRNGNIGSVHYKKYYSYKEVYEWNDSLHQVDTIVKRILCPEVIRYNGEYINIWTYSNDNGYPGLVLEP